MKLRVLAPMVVLTCAGGLMTVGTTSASAASTDRSSAAPAATICREAGGNLTLRHRAPVHTQPSGRSAVDFIAASGRTFRIGGYCDNSAGNRWFCVAQCDFSDTPTGLWIWEEYFRA